MSLTISSDGGGNFEMAPAGTHLATCYRIIDLGTQKTNWQGQEKAQPKVLIAWELAGDKMADGRPFTVSKRYTASLHEKAGLRKDLESWRGRKFSEDELKAFNISKLLGVPCMVCITHDHKEGGKTYVNVSSVMGIPKGTTAPALVNLKTQFDLSNFDKEIYDSLSDNLRATIAMSPEFIACMHDPRLDDQHREENQGAADDPF